MVYINEFFCIKDATGSDLLLKNSVPFEYCCMDLTGMERINSGWSDSTGDDLDGNDLEINRLLR